MANKISRRDFLTMSGIATVSVTPVANSLQKIFVGGQLILDAVPDIVFSYVRAKDLLYMQISCYDCSGNASGALTFGQKAYLKVYLPHGHITEQTFTKEEFATDFKTPAEKFLSDRMTFLFRVKKGIINLEEVLANWHETNKIQLIGVDQPSSQYELPRSGLFPDSDVIRSRNQNDIYPKTTIEAPAGIYLSPFSKQGIGQLRFQFPNSLLSGKPAENGNKFIVNEAARKGLKKEQLIIRYASRPGKSHTVNDDSTDIKNPAEIYESYELWSNDLIGSDLRPPKFKIVGTVPFKVTGKNLIPDSFDKDDLGRQFAKNPDDLVEVYSQFFKLTGLGLYTKLSYTSTDIDDILQKWKQEMVIGRDQFIEIERLGYHHPFGIRMAEVTIGRRKIDEVTGISYIEREYFIKPIDTELVYRLPEDQGETSSSRPDEIPTPQQLKDSVLVPDADVLKNKVRQIKRSLPFQKIIVNTTISQPIKNVRDEMDKILSVREADYNKIVAQVRQVCDQLIQSYFDDFQKFLLALKSKSDALSQKDIKKNWPGVATWIRNLILNGNLTQAGLTDFLALIKNGKLDSYLNFQRYLGDLTEFLRDPEKNLFQWAADSQILDLAEKLKGHLAELNKELSKITYNINQLYQVALNYTPEDFKNQFTQLTNGVDISVEAAYNEIVERIKNNQTDARNQLILGAESFFNKYYDKIKDLPDAADRKNKFERALTNYREKMNKISALASGALDNPLEVVLAYWPQTRTGNEVIFNFTGIDWDGNKVNLPAPVMFVKQEAVVQIKKLVDKADRELGGLKDKGNNIIGKIGEAENYLRSEGKRLSEQINKVNNLAKNPDSTIAQIQDELKLIAPEGFQKVKDIYDKVHDIDNQIKNNYENISNQVLRQLPVYQQKVAYYKRLTEQITDKAKQQVTTLETEFLEFSASGMAEIAIINKTINENAKAELKEFATKFRNAFPQLEAAKAALPVIKDIANFDKGTLIRYGDAYRSAGIELIKDAENDPAYVAIRDLQKKGLRNAEKILFEVQQQNDKCAAIADEEKRALEKIFNQRLSELNDLKNGALGSANQFRGKVTNWTKNMQAQANTWFDSQRNYASGQIDSLFANAGQQLAGTAIPGTVVKAISLYDNAYASVKGDVDKYTGEIKNYITNTESDIKQYTAGAQDQLKHMLQDLQIFGIKLVDYLIPDVEVGLHQLPRQDIKEIRDTVTNVLKSRDLIYQWDITVKHIFQTNGILRNGNGDANSPDATLSCKLEMRIPQIEMTKPGVPGPAAEINSVISLSNFGIAIPMAGQDLIAVYFRSVNFIKTSTARFGDVTNTSHMDVQIANVEFKYLLELIKKLEELLGIDKAFVPKITSRGVSLEIGINIPPISIGAFSIINAAIFAGVTLPFGSGERPSVNFAFSEKENPFTIAAGIFGGRGFIGLAADSAGMKRFEASLEFGGYLGLNFGIAKGQAYLMAGIYFRWQRADAVFIEGYVVCGGNLNLLGIVQVSVVFYLGLSYQGGSLNGRASVTVSIHMLFFSASYSLSFEKHISGSESNLQKTGLNYRNNQTQWAYSNDAGSKSNHDYLIEDYLDEPKAEAPYYIKNKPNDKKKVAVYDPEQIFAHHLNGDPADKNSDAQLYAQLFDL